MNRTNGKGHDDLTLFLDGEEVPFSRGENHLRGSGAAPA